MNYHMEILAYIGPDTMLPMTSIVATVVGMTLMFGRYVFQNLARVCRIVMSGPVHGALKKHRRSRQDEAASCQMSVGARHDGA